MNGRHPEHDHGTWDGRWSLPSRSSWEVLEMAGWRRTQGDAMVAVRVATREQREKWVENGAIEVLSLADSRAVLQDLE